jgi:glycosyltransferase involved in cell wall biosynthesis
MLTSATATAQPVPPAAQECAPLLSVVMPTYKRAMRLERSFRFHLKAFAETRHPMEFVVFDNGSPDATREVVADWMAEDARIRYVRHVENRGFRPNFLSAFRGGRGKYVMYLADDDLLIPEIVEKCIDRLEADPSIGAIYAPWFLLNETKSNTITGASWNVTAEELFEAGNHAACLDFLLKHHAFPELLIVRSELVAETFSTHCSVAYHYFTLLAHLLAKTSVLFIPEPFTIVTAISHDSHVGNAETLYGWDEYRGGIEYLASFCRADRKTTYPDPDRLLKEIQTFANNRMAVALRLHLGARNWLAAWHLNRRLLAYDMQTAPPHIQDELAALAAMESIVTEFSRANVAEIVACEKVFAMMREVMNIPEAVKLLCETDSDFDKHTTGGVRGFVTFNGDPERPLREGDMALDLAVIIRRFEAPN